MVTTPQIVETRANLRERIAAWRAAGERIALVPTMGALHAGHIALVDLARENADRVVVSIFVNPAQFAPHEDFDRYPRTIESDVAALEGHGCDLVYAPRRDEMYPEGFSTRVLPEGGPSDGLESDARPHFFGGVATVVTKLFTQCRPDIAIFGEKDYQQLLVVERLSRDLDLDVAIVRAPIFREADGLALSSRNRYLSAEERAAAPFIHHTLSETAALIAGGGPLPALLTQAAQALASRGFTVDYVAARHADTLAPVGSAAEGPIRLLAAARIGTTRLIDNVGVPAPSH